MNKVMTPASQTAVTRLERNYVLVLWLLLFGYILYLFIVCGLDFACWDPLYLSGTVTLIIALQLVRTLSRRVTIMLDRLAHSQGEVSDTTQMTQFKDDLENKAAVWAHRSGLFVVLVIIVAYAVAFRGLVTATASVIVNSDDFAMAQQLEPLIMVIAILIPFVLIALSIPGGYIVGRHLGRMALYGRLCLLLKQADITLEVQPGHPDGAAGFKPIGDFYFYQAMLAAIPAIFLAVWWLLIPLAPKYMRWRSPYVILLAVVLLFEILSFIVPLWYFHRSMQAQKVGLLQKADDIGRQIAQLKSALVEAKTDAERKSLTQQLTNLTDYYWAIERMPTWPVDTKTRRRFTWNNLILFFPIFSEMIGLSGAVARILEVLITLPE